MRLHRLSLAFGLAMLPLVVVAASNCVGQDDDGGPGRETPVSATPDANPKASQASALHDARLEAAKYLGVEALKVELIELREAGFDGCLGVYYPNRACTQQFIGGYVAVFRGGGKNATFHFGGAQFVGPVEKLTGARIDPGSPVPPEIAPDFAMVLAAYVRHDLALRTNRDATKLVQRAIDPVFFPDGCIGWETKPGQACDTVITPGAIVLIEDPASGKVARYHASVRGVIATDFVAGRATVEPDAKLLDLQLRMRQDLAGKLGVPLEQVSLRAYRDVTWPDGCLGVVRPGTLCTQALVDGFLALLTGGAREYRYHGAGDQFIAASLEPGVTVGEPLPGR